MPDEEQLELSLLMGIQNGLASLKSNLTVSQKVKHILNTQPSNLISSYLLTLEK